MCSQASCSPISPKRNHELCCRVPTCAGTIRPTVTLYNAPKPAGDTLAGIQLPEHRGLLLLEVS